MHVNVKNIFKLRLRRGVGVPGRGVRVPKQEKNEANLVEI